jgi:hypothetical protein
MINYFNQLIIFYELLIPSQTNVLERVSPTWFKSAHIGGAVLKIISPPGDARWFEQVRRKRHQAVYGSTG